MARLTGRVLIVDDEANARHALAEWLNADGHSTEVAADGEQALHRLQGFAPDVVLTDLKMPKVGGLELLARGRELAPPQLLHRNDSLRFYR